MNLKVGRLVRSIAIVIFLLMLSVGMTQLSDATNVEETPVELSEYILQCYDSNSPGFGDSWMNDNWTRTIMIRLAIFTINLTAFQFSSSTVKFK